MLMHTFVYWNNKTNRVFDPLDGAMRRAPFGDFGTTRNRGKNANTHLVTIHSISQPCPHVCGCL